MRKEFRVIGIDDGPFNKFKDKKVLVVGTIFRGGTAMDGLVSTYATVDGTDATYNITKMINQCKFKPQLRAILFKGIAVGGFNVIDMKKLYEKTKIPVIVVVRNYPDFAKIYSALKKLGFTRRKKIIEKMPKPQKINSVYAQYFGLNIQKASEIIEITTTRSLIPEPLRIAHIIAAGIIKGESKGRA